MTHARTEFFDGTNAQYERLRQAVTWLHDADGITSSLLASQAKLQCNHTVLDKFRRPNGTKRINYEDANRLWHYIALHRPEAPGFHHIPAHHSQSDGEAFFNGFVKYYDVHKFKTGERAAHLTGRYRFYQYSEEFNNYGPDLPCAIVIGEFCIAAEGGVVSVVETQGYDGKLGRIAMTETYTGYCFPKGHEFYFLMKETTRDTPKLCVFYDVHHEGTPQRVKFMKGYMLKGSYDDTYFHSPVYALRDDDGEITPNILRPADVPAHILTELNKKPVTLREADP